MPIFLAESYLHTHDPFAIQVTESHGIRWYGLAYLTGFLVGWGLITWLARTGRSAVRPAQVGDMLFYLVFGVIVGGRLGYCLFYDPSLFVDPPLVGVLMIWKGGMSSHGGLMGVIVGAWLFYRRHRIPLLHIFDVAALACPAGLGLGRVANFINAELMGKVLPVGLRADPPWWSIKYSGEVIESALVWEPKLRAVPGLVDLVPGDAALPSRVAEALRAGNEAVIAAVQPLLTPYYPSQVFQAISDGPALFLILAIIWCFPFRPGVVGGSFLLSYGAMRVLTEVFRQPDLGVSLTWGLSRGQLLSTVMIAGGLVMIVVCARRKAAPIGGLLRPGSVDRGADL